MEKRNDDAPEREMRCMVSDLTVERRDDGQPSRTISGYAMKFEVKSRPICGFFEEIIRRGAFDGCDMEDVVMNYMHDNQNLLARTGSGTLRMEIDDVGAKFSFEAPNTTLGNDMLEMVDRGDIRECSFAFNVKEDRWTFANEENGMKYDLREVLRIARLWDLSLVVRGAYPDTEVSRRMYEQRKKEAQPDEDARKKYNIDRRYRRIKIKTL